MLVFIHMIKLMRKLFQAASTVALFLATAPKVFAQAATATSPPPTGIPFDVPKQFLTGVSVGNIPQFLITLLFLVGVVIAVVFLIYGGIKWILSGGDSKQVEGARNHIVAAIVGLIIVVGAFFILNFVFQLLTGQPFSFKDICIPNLKSGGTCASPVPLATP